MSTPTAPPPPSLDVDVKKEELFEEFISQMAGVKLSKSESFSAVLAAETHKATVKLIKRCTAIIVVTIIVASIVIVRSCRTSGLESMPNYDNDLSRLFYKTEAVHRSLEYISRRLEKIETSTATPKTSAVEEIIDALKKSNEKAKQQDSLKKSTEPHRGQSEGDWISRDSTGRCSQKDENTVTGEYKFEHLRNLYNHLPFDPVYGDVGDFSRERMATKEYHTRHYTFTPKGKAEKPCAAIERLMKSIEKERRDQVFPSLADITAVPHFYVNVSSILCSALGGSLVSKVYAKRFIAKANEKVVAVLDNKNALYAANRWAIDYGWEEYAKDVIEEIKSILATGGVYNTEDPIWFRTDE